jgi:hypothetical protein
MYQFLAEARRLWELESCHTSLTNIQAALVLNITYNVNGLDTIGNNYLTYALYHAEQMQLLDPCPEIKDRQMRNARYFTAWSLFNYQTYEFPMIFLIYTYPWQDGVFLLLQGAET